MEYRAIVYCLLAQSDNLISFDIMNEVMHSDGSIGGRGYGRIRGARVCGCVWDVGWCMQLLWFTSSGIGGLVIVGSKLDSNSERKFSEVWKSGEMGHSDVTIMVCKEHTP